MAAKPKRRGRPPEKALTDAQRRGLQVVKDFIARKKFPPTMQELGVLLEVTAASAHQLIKQLERKGFVTRQPRQARSLAVVREAPQKVQTLVEVPLVGSVKAGPAMLAEENLEGHVLVELGVCAGGACFALNISGDSMQGAGMHDGDVIIVRRQPVAESGEIVVALLENEATVKRLSILKDRIELRAENRRYKPIVVSPDADFRILGKVVAVRHPARR